MSAMRVTAKLISSLPEAARGHIKQLKRDRVDALNRAELAERGVRNLAAENAALKAENAALKSAGAGQ